MVKAFRLFPPNRLVDEGLKILREKFESPEHLGPAFVANFFEEEDPETQVMIRRDAFERVRALVEALDQ